MLICWTKLMQISRRGKNFGITSVVVFDDTNENAELSIRNLKGVKFLRTEGLNVYDIVKHDWCVFTERAIAKINDRLSGKA